MQQLASQGITEYDFSEPVYGPNPKKAIAQAHVNAAKKSLEKHGYIFVMENDIQFTHKDSTKYFLDNYKNLPEDWDVYLMGYYHHNRDFKQVPPFRKLREFTAFHGYILNPRMIDKMMPHEGCRVQDVDVYLAYNGARIYAIEPVVAIQDHTFVSERLGRKKVYTSAIAKLNLYKG